MYLGGLGPTFAFVKLRMMPSRNGYNLKTKKTIRKGMTNVYAAGLSFRKVLLNHTLAGNCWAATWFGGAIGALACMFISPKTYDEALFAAWAVSPSSAQLGYVAILFPRCSR